MPKRNCNGLNKFWRHAHRQQRLKKLGIPPLLTQRSPRMILNCMYLAKALTFPLFHSIQVIFHAINKCINIPIHTYINVIAYLLCDRRSGRTILPKEVLKSSITKCFGQPKSNIICYCEVFRSVAGSADPQLQQNVASARCGFALHTLHWTAASDRSNLYFS
jgi:hypothetical protein